MLETLDDIDWSQYEEGYWESGDPDDIRKYIRALTSNKLEEHTEAIIDFYQVHMHRAMTAAIPFLVELIQSRRIKCRGEIVELLCETARLVAGDQEDTPLLDAHVLSNKEFWTRSCDRRNHPVIRLKWVHDVRLAIWQGWEPYTKLTADRNRLVRIQSTYLLGLLGRMAHLYRKLNTAVNNDRPRRLIPKTLLTRLDEESNDQIRANIVFSLACWAHFNPKLQRRLRDLVEDESECRAVRFSAALFLMDITADPPEAAIDLLAAVLTESDWRQSDALFDTKVDAREVKNNRSHKRSPYYGPRDSSSQWLRSPGEAVVKRLPRLDARYSDRFATTLIAMLESGWGLSFLAPTLRHLVFKNRKLTARNTGKSLTTTQRAVLQMLYDDESNWTEPSSRWLHHSYSEFDELGVPPDRELIGRWLRRSQKKGRA